MRFIDEVEIRVVSGKGGRGCVSFRREKYVPFGGPDGGDGGHGGSVYLEATPGLNTLAAFRGRRVYEADNGQPGEGRQKTGRCADDLIIPVPTGTVAHDRDAGVVLADLVSAGDRVCVAQGGHGGKGNVAFRSSTNRTPRKCTPGGPGEQRNLALELRLLADAGVIGFPNAGKSTLVSVVSAARPRIADYPFTTLVPSLGVVDRGLDGSWVIADVPGLIAGAADGAGLGHRFLRHIQRTRVLIHLVSALPDGEGTPVERYRILRAELERYDPALAVRPELVALSKIDAVPESLFLSQRQALEAAVGGPVILLSAVAGQGVKALLDAAWVHLNEADR